MTIKAVSPATGEVVGTYEEMTAAGAAGAVDRAREAFLAYRETSFDHRSVLLRRAAGILRERGPDLARLMALEMGKPVTAGLAEIAKSAGVCDYYADNAAYFLADEIVETEASRSLVAYRPLGVILAVMPWNFPFWQVFRFAAPALMAGNAALLKHASNVPGCALAVQEALSAAGFPPGLFRTLLIASGDVGAVLRHGAIAAATLTGSGPAGRAVASAAGDALKKTVLELGGSDPYVVLEDADLASAATMCATSRLINSGQSCIAAKRFIVVDPVREEFTRLIAERMSAARMGDPLDPATEVGPLARPDLRVDLHLQVVRSVEMGARPVLGGEIPPGPGSFYPPTVLSGVRPGMPAFDEETFGPVAAIVPARDEDEAVRLANATPYGLGAAVFTRDRDRGEDIATRRLEAGSCFVNAYVRSDPRLPFGGIGQSGYGRELGRHGILEFVNAKTVYVA